MSREIKCPEEMSVIQALKCWLKCCVPEYAEAIKVIFQMVIGLGILLIVVVRLVRILSGDEIAPDEPAILVLVSAALAYAAAIELAYMLFTPGPDEAIDPAILGIASLILSVAARADTHIESSPGEFLDAATGIALLVISLALLFVIRTKLLPRNEQDDECKKQETARPPQNGAVLREGSAPTPGEQDREGANVVEMRPRQNADDNADADLQIVILKPDKREIIKKQVHALIGSILGIESNNQ